MYAIRSYYERCRGAETAVTLKSANRYKSGKRNIIMSMIKQNIAIAVFLATAGVAHAAGGDDSPSGVSVNPLKDVFFGNFHVHTSYSFDGYTNA